MSESTLSLNWDDLRAEIALEAGYGLDSTRWNANQTALIQRLLDAGYRSFLTARILMPDKSMLTHTWSFLKPSRTLGTGAPYDTGTLAVTAGSATVTLSGGTFPTWADAGELLISDVRYDVIRRISATQVTLADNYRGSTASGLSYALRSAQVLLPDDFGGIDGDLLYADTTHSGRVGQTNEARIKALREGSTATGTPREFAIRARPGTATTGQRFEIMFDPVPDAAYVYQFSMHVLVNRLSQQNYWPLGGMKHAETLRACCRAAVEDTLNNQRGARYAEMIDLMQASIAEDRKLVAPSTIGPGDDTPYRGRYSVRLQLNGVYV